MKHTEVEQKFQLENHAQLRERLKEEGAKKLGSEHQVDVYYNAPHRDFLAQPRINEWLRLRYQNGKASINYKLWQPLDAEIKTHCDEFESELSDLEAIQKLFNALDFTEITVVDKHRETWQFLDLEIALDSVKGLGDFVEFY